MKYLFLLAAMLPATFLQAQDCDLVLSGRVVDEHNSKGLAYANVQLLNANISRLVASDEEGVFRMEGLCPGAYSLVTSHVGCEPDTVRISLRSDTTLEFYLEHHVGLLEMLRIEAKRPHRDIAASTELDRMEILGNEGASLANLLEDQEGVQVLSSSSNTTKPVIHGMHSNRLVIMNDNTRLESQRWGGEHAPEIDPLAANNIEIVSGASSLRYGPEAIAGAVIVKGDGYLQDSVLNGWLHTAGSSNGRKGTAAAQVQGRLMKKRPVYVKLNGTAVSGGDMITPDRYYLDNTGVRQYQGEGRLAWKSARFGAEARYSLFYTDLGILSYSHIGNLSDLEKAISSDWPLTPSLEFSRDLDAPEQHVEHETSAFKTWFAPSLHNKWSLSISRQYNLRQEFDAETFSEEGVPDLQYEITTWQSDLAYEHRWGAHWKSEFGLAGQQQANTYTGRFFIPNFKNYQGGAFTIQHWQFERSEIEAGVRYDYRWQQAFMYQDDTIYSPIRTFDGLAWNVGYSFEQRQWRFLTNLGRAWRPPAINELYSSGLHHGAAAVEFGDEQLAEERSYGWTNKFQWERIGSDRLQWSGQITAYAHYFESFIYLVPEQPATLTIRGAFPTFRNRSVESLFRGLDVNTHVDVSNTFRYTMGFDWVRATDLSNGQDLVTIAPARLRAAIGFNQQEEFERWPMVVFNARWVFEQGNFPRGVDYAPPPEAYMLFGLTVQQEVELWKTSVIYTFRIENITNTAYRSYMNRLRYFADEPGRNFLLSVRIPFELKR